MPWSDVYLGSAVASEYAAPLRASKEWWSCLEDVVKAVLVTSGTEELFADDIKDFAAKLKVFPSLFFSFFFSWI